MSRRRLLGMAGLGGLAMMSAPARSQSMVDLPLPGGPGARRIATDFPEKGAMIVQRTRPPMLETPWDVFDKGVFTPNDQFYVRWHWAVIPTEIDIGSFRLAVHGHVSHPCPCRSMTFCMASRESSWPPSISAPAIRAASSSRGCPGGNGRTAPWATRCGPACG